jgi:serine/threonine-protein kinase
VRVLDDGRTESGTPYLVMDLLEGETLTSRIAKRGPLPLEEAVRIMDAVLDVLGAAHQLGIVHRDVKPDNVFVTRQGDVKLLDFGIARGPVVGDHGAHEPRADAADTGLIVGSLEFMAPEQAAADTDRIGAASDLWAAGATLFVALTSRMLRRGSTPQELLASARQPTPPVRTLAPELPPAVAEVLDRALALDPSERFRSADAMRVALMAAAIARSGIDRVQHADPPPAQPLQPSLGSSVVHDAPPRLGSTGGRRAYVLAAAGAALLLALVAYAVLSPATPSSTATRVPSLLPPVPSVEARTEPVAIPMPTLSIATPRPPTRPIEGPTPAAPAAAPLAAPVAPPVAGRSATDVRPAGQAPAGTSSVRSSRPVVDPMSGRF